MYSRCKITTFFVKKPRIPQKLVVPGRFSADLVPVVCVCVVEIEPGLYVDFGRPVTVLAGLDKDAM